MTIKNSNYQAGVTDPYTAGMQAILPDFDIASTTPVASAGWQNPALVTNPYTTGMQAILPDFGFTPTTSVNTGWRNPALTTTPAAAGSDWMTTWFGGTDAQTGNLSPGILPVGIGALTGLAGAYTGLEQLQVAKDNLAFQKDAFNKNFANQAKLTNSQLADRQRARVMDSPGAYESVGDYMNKYGV